MSSPHGLFPGTGVGAARTLWLLIALSFAILPLAGMSRPLSAACGALALIAAGVLFRRWVLFPAIALIILFTAWMGNMEDLYVWIRETIRGVFW